MRFGRILACGAVTLFALGWPAASADTITVTLRSLKFDPQIVTVRVGDTVAWIHRDGNRKHSVTANTESRIDGEDFDSHPTCEAGLLRSCMRRSDVFRHEFLRRGTFTYYCKIHGLDAPYPDCRMCGQVRVVTSSATGSPTVPTIGPPTPTTTGSPTSSASPTGIPSNSPTGGVLGAPPSDGASTGNTLAIAAGALVLLSGSGLLVYRTLIRR